MLNNRNVLVSALVLLVGLLLFGLFKAAFVAEEVEFRTGPSAKARFNGWLALERFAAEMGMPSETAYRARGLFDKAAPEDTIVINARDMAREPAVRDEALAWVGGGGHLLLAGRPLSGDEEGWLEEELGLGLETAEEAPSSVSVQLYEQRDYPIAPRRHGQLVVTDQHDRADVRFRTPQGIFGLSMPYGEGRLTYFPNADWFGNELIDKAEHATLIWHTLRYWDLDGKLWVLPRIENQNLFTWLWQHAAWALLAFAVFVALWLWRASRRFGPMLPPRGKARRSLREHLNAVGRFLWQHHQQEGLLQSVRDALMHRVHTLNPAWVHLPMDTLSDKLATATGLSAQRIHHALTAPAPKSPREFTLIIDTLDTVRKRL